MSETVGLNDSFGRHIGYISTSTPRGPRTLAEECDELWQIVIQLAERIKDLEAAS